tara:strand:- start:99 stop:809 length:711 start_codon:yes stop_codon:yes gene_type:complete
MLKIVVFSLFLVALLRCSVNSDIDSESEPHNYLEFEEFDSPIKLSGQLPIKLKDDLLSKGIDTVLLFERTCIDCCDFYNVFWKNGNEAFLHKFYYDTDTGKNRSIRIKTEHDSIFNFIEDNYSELKQNGIKGNSHILEKKGDTITLAQFTISSHYCYSVIELYSKSDSIVSGQIKDIDFYAYANGNIKRESSIPNDNFKKNINSKWYTLLNDIEDKISSMKETSSKEKEVLRNPLK